MSWIYTYTGKKLDFLNPTPDMICIEDIAHALSFVPRYQGHTREFYSVAQHSVLVATLCPDALMIEGLLHDATEAYMGDINSPLKALLPDFKYMEKVLDRVIRERFGLLPQEPQEVKEIDIRLRNDEMNAFHDHHRGDPDKMYGITMASWPSHVAKQAFMQMFATLFNEGYVKS